MKTAEDAKDAEVLVLFLRVLCVLGGFELNPRSSALIRGEGSLQLTPDQRWASLKYRREAHANPA